MNEIDILKDNINSLQNELNIAHKRIAELREVADITDMLTSQLIKSVDPQTNFGQMLKKLSTALDSILSTERSIS